jgi:hypothetical protein
MAAVAAILIKCQGTAPVDALAAGLRAVAAQARLAGWPVERIVAYAWESGTHPGPEVYAYLWLRAPRATPMEVLPAFPFEVGGLPAQAFALERVDERSGASRGKSAPVHYVVETDIEPGREAEVYGWYDHEHMEGLAAVPGTVRAQRFINLAGSPRVYACYDLMSAQTRDTPQWLAVRATEWASRARPHFRNTKRTTFERLFDIAA